MRRNLLAALFPVAAILGVLAVVLFVLNGQKPDSPQAAPRDQVPSDVLDLTNWKLTLPESKADSPMDPSDDDPDAAEVRQPKLATYSDRNFFHLNSAGDGVVFRARVDGATTSGSGYPRSELREMTDGGKEKADWTNKRGVHTMTIVEAITNTPDVKPDVVAGQIHDGDDDVVMIRLEDKKLFVEADGDEIGVLDKNYREHTKFTVVIKADSDGIRITYNGKKTVTYDKTGSGWYFKAGCYTQSKDGPDKDDDDDGRKYDKPDRYGEVTIYDLKVEHKS